MLIFKNGIMDWNQPSSQLTFDEDGNVIKDAAIPTCVQCYIDTLTEDAHAKYVGGDYNHRSYSVLIDMDSVEGEFSPVSVRLTHEDKGELGEFQVQRVEFYKLTRSIQVWVG